MGTCSPLFTGNLEIQLSLLCLCNQPELECGLMEESTSAALAQEISVEQWAVLGEQCTVTYTRTGLPHVLSWSWGGPPSGWRIRGSSRAHGAAAFLCTSLPDSHKQLPGEASPAQGGPFLTWPCGCPHLPLAATPATQPASLRCPPSPPASLFLPSGQ